MEHHQTFEHWNCKQHCCKTNSGAIPVLDLTFYTNHPTHKLRSQIDTSVFKVVAHLKISLLRHPSHLNLNKHKCLEYIMRPFFLAIDCCQFYFYDFLLWFHLHLNLCCWFVGKLLYPVLCLFLCLLSIHLGLRKKKKFYYICLIMDCIYLQLNHAIGRQTTSETGREPHEERMKRKIHQAILTGLIFFTNFQSLFLQHLFTTAVKKE